MTKNRSVIVVGGGIAGPVAAIALQRAGLTPVLHEAYEQGADDRGAWLTVAVNGLTALRDLDLDPGVLLAAGFATPVMTMHNSAGRPLADLPLGGPTADGTTSTTIRRADLYAALRAEAQRRGIAVHHGKRLVGVERGSEGVTATFADGSCVTGELLVGADGLHSRTREVLNPGGPGPRYLGLLNAAGRAPAGVDTGFEAAPGVFHMAFGRRCFLGWTTAPDGSTWWFANPPQRDTPTRAELGGWEPARWRAHLLELFAGDALPATALIEATDEIHGPWGTYDLPRVPVWRDERIVLVGDAAHAASPSSGQGAAMAIEDAVTLGRCLRRAPDVPEALAAYERLRRGRVEKVVAYGRRSGSPKIAGPIGAAVRDLMLPAVLRMLYRKGNPQAWILDHRIDDDFAIAPPAAR